MDIKFFSKNSRTEIPTKEQLMENTQEKMQDRTGLRVGYNAIRTFSGRWLDLLDPKPDQFNFEDIAIPLSRICRYGSQPRIFYSVAEHSILCARQAQRDGFSSDVQKALLMHDCAEAFIGDIVRPLKVLLPLYYEVEKKLEDVVAKKYGIDFENNKSTIKKIDNEMLFAERKMLFLPDGEVWEGEEKFRVIEPVIMSYVPNQASHLFAEMAWALGIDVDTDKGYKDYMAG